MDTAHDCSEPLQHPPKQSALIKNIKMDNTVGFELSVQHTDCAHGKFLQVTTCIMH